MRKYLLGIAAITLAATSAHAQPGNGHGGGPNGGEQGKGRGEGKPAGQAAPARKSDHQPPAAAMRETGPGAARQDKRGPQREDRSDSPAQASRGSGGNGQPAMASRDKSFRANAKDGNRSTPFRWSSAPSRGLVNGCPPGLARKDNGCTPPGLARNDSWGATYDRPDWWGYRNWTDGRYRYVDGYLVRYDGGRILSYIPLLGGALAVGQPWPSFYEPVALPGYYQSYYGLGPSYRYADNVLYRLDGADLAINSIAALLTGDDLTIGQPLPDHYGVYNVPYSYRDRYVDGPDALYRYSDGYVYEVDPTTRLVQAAIELLI